MVLLRKHPNDIQVLPLELNFRKSKWLIVPLYRPPVKPKDEFNKYVSRLIDNYADTYDNVLLLGDFNMEANDKEMIPLINDHNLYSMIKEPTCFFSNEGCFIDIMHLVK